MRVGASGVPKKDQWYSGLAFEAPVPEVARRALAREHEAGMSVLRSERLSLEPLDERYRNDFARLAANPRVVRYIGDGRTLGARA